MKKQVYSKLDKLWHRGKIFLNTDYSILAGAMTWVSDYKLTAATSNAGAFGVLATGNLDLHELNQQIKLLQQHTSKSYGVNLIVMHPKIEEQIQVCIQCGVEYVILAGGMPKDLWINTLKDSGIKVICFAASLKLAQRLVQRGADALIIEGMEAGGHVGPISTTVLAQTILPFIKEVPVFVAGGIGRGEAIVSYLQMGAAGCQLGTRFVCAKESGAHANFKQAYIKARSHNAVVTESIDMRYKVIPVRAIQNSAFRDFKEFQLQIVNKLDNKEIGLDKAQLDIEYFWKGSLRKAAIEGDVENGSLMAGQSVEFVKSEQKCDEIIQEILIQAEMSVEKNN